MSKQNLKRHLQKFAKATRASFAKLVLQEDQIQFLTTINNEAKVRRSSKSLVLGTAKVMSYEDLEDAWAKCAEKEAARAAKGKSNRGQKPKSSAPEPEAPEPKSKVARISKAQVAGDVIMPEPWKAPVARMY